MGSNLSVCANCQNKCNIKRNSTYCISCESLYTYINLNMERLEEYKKERFTPLDKKYEIYNTAFIGNVCKYNTKSIILLGNGKNVGNLFWEILSFNIEEDFLSGLAIQDNFMGKDLLAIPKDVFIVIGMSTGSNVSLIDKGKMQVYLPKKIVEALLPSSKLFLSSILSSISKLAFTKTASKDVTDIQNNWWEQYKVECFIAKHLGYN